MGLVLLCGVCHPETFPKESSILRSAFRRIYRLVRCVSLLVLDASSLKCDEYIMLHESISYFAIYDSAAYRGGIKQSGCPRARLSVCESIFTSIIS